jgi:uncharacterized membrane protein required for colicin V production
VIADIILIFIVGINLFWGYKRGFLSSALKMITTLFSLVIAFFLAKPVAEGILDKNWQLTEKISPWINDHAGWVARFLGENHGKITLWLMTFVGLFIVIRLLLIIIDRLLGKIKENMPVVNFLDKTAGFFFGIVMSAVYILGLFWVLDALSSINFLENLPKWLQLTKDGGGFIAWRIFELWTEGLAQAIKDLVTNVTGYAWTQVSGQ